MGNLVYDFKRIAPMTGGDGSKIELAARLGYLAKGLVYATVGVLATMAAFGMASGKLTGTRGALEALNNESWGMFVLALLAIGLLGFTTWRLVQAISDTEDKGDDFTGYMQRAGLAISGLIYGSLAFYAGKLLMNHGGGSGGNSAQERAATVMAHDGGVLLVGAVGLGFIGVGLYQFYRALSDRFKRNWKTAQMSHKEEKTATWISRFGIGARAVSFVIIGGFLVHAAVTHNPQEAIGLSGALTELAQQAYGQWLVALTGLGLLSYGLYCFVNALFRSIDAHESAPARRPSGSRPQVVH